MGRVRCFVITRGDIRGCRVYSSVVEGGGRESASGLWLQGGGSMLTVMLGEDLDGATRVQTWIPRPGLTDVHTLLSDCDSA